MAQPAAAAAAVVESPKKTTVADWSKSTMLRTLRLSNMCNGIGLITTGICSFLISSLGGGAGMTFTGVS